MLNEAIERLLQPAKPPGPASAASGDLLPCLQPFQPDAQAYGNTQDSVRPTKLLLSPRALEYTRGYWSLSLGLSLSFCSSTALGTFQFLRAGAVTFLVLDADQ